MTTYKGVLSFDEIIISANFANAASQILTKTDEGFIPTQYQIADCFHDVEEAFRLIIKDMGRDYYGHDDGDLEKCMEEIEIEMLDDDGDGDGDGKNNVADWETVDGYVDEFPDERNINGIGTCTVEVQIGQYDGKWYVRTQDDAGGSDDYDDGAFPSRAAAISAAKQYCERGEN